MSFTQQALWLKFVVQVTNCSEKFTKDKEQNHVWKTLLTGKIIFNIKLNSSFVSFALLIKSVICIKKLKMDFSVNLKSL